MKIKSIKRTGEVIPTWDLEVQESHHYLLKNGCVSHNTSLLVGSTASVLPIYKKYFIETNKFASAVNVAPNLNSENFWFYKEYINMNMNDVIDMMTVVYKWIDQSISFEWIINPERTSPAELYSYYMKAWRQGIKTVYYVRSMSLETKECVSCSG